MSVSGGTPCGSLRFGAANNAAAHITSMSMLDFYNGGGCDTAFLGCAEASPSSIFYPLTPGYTRKEAHECHLATTTTSLTQTRCSRVGLCICVLIAVIAHSLPSRSADRYDRGGAIRICIYSNTGGWSRERECEQLRWRPQSRLRWLY